MTGPPGPGWTGEPPARTNGAVRADRSGLALAVTDVVTGDPLGAVGIVSADHEHAIAEIGYWVAPVARSAGFRLEGVLRSRIVHRGGRRDIAMWAWCVGDGDAS